MLVVIPGSNISRHAALMDRVIRCRLSISVDEKAWTDLRKPDGSNAIGSTTRTQFITSAWAATKSSAISDGCQPRARADRSVPRALAERAAGLRVEAVLRGPG